MASRGTVPSKLSSARGERERDAAVLSERYELLCELGRGASGTVWQARDVETGALLAVKLLHSAKSISSVARKRFLREITSASALVHPHSVEVLTHGETADGVPYLVMERLTGRTLAAELREQGALPQMRAIKIVAQILEALAAAHELGIVHRDVKPGNVMLVARDGQSDYVKVCDFGLAKAFEPEHHAFEARAGRRNEFESVTTEQGDLCGTPEFMAPEQARGESIDGRADLYAVGVLLFQAVVGALPFQGRTTLATISLHLSAAPPRPSALRPDLRLFPALENLILRALAKDRAERPSSARVFRADLLQVERDYAKAWSAEDSTPTLASAPSTDITPRSNDRAKRKRFAGQALLLSSVVVGTGLGSQFLGRVPASGTATSQAPAGSNSAALVAVRASRPATVDSTISELAPSAAPKARTPTPRQAMQHPSARASPSASVEPQPDLARGEQLLGQGRIAEACALGRALWDASPTSARTAEFLGRCYMRLGDAVSGRRYYRRFLELAPSDPRSVFVRAILEGGENRRE